MDSFELNKIIGAVLGTLLFVMGVGFIAEAIYEPIEGRGPGYELPEAEGSDHGGGGEEPETVSASIGVLLASADAGEGEGQARKCQACHTFTEGGANGQGPNLWDIVGRPVASHAGFAYSEAMVAHAAEEPAWTYEALNEFLLAPRADVPNTKMNFAGLGDDEERANIIAFLSTLSASPQPFPPAEAPAGTTEGAVSAPASETVVVNTPTEASPAVEGTPTGSNEPAGGDAPAAAEPPAMQAPAMQAPATQAPATSAPAAQPAPAGAAPAAQPAPAAPGQPAPAAGQ